MMKNSVGQAYRSPYMERMCKAFGLDPEMTSEELWYALMQVVVSFDAPMFVKTIPSGAMTYGEAVDYNQAQNQSDRIYLRLNSPGIALGACFTITATTFPPPQGTTVPGLDDVLVQIDYNREQDYMVARQITNQSVASAAQTGFATCTSQDYRTRLWMQLLPDTDAEMGFTFMSRYAQIGSGSNLGVDIRISVDLIVKELSDYNADRLLPQ